MPPALSSTGRNPMSEPTLTPPAGGAKITIANGKLTVPNNPIVPFIEGDGTGRDIWRASVRVFDAAWKKPTKASARFTGWKSTPAKNPSSNSTLAAGRDRHRLPRLPGLDQGPADDADRRRHPLAQRRAAPDARPVRVPAPGALVQGRAFAGQGVRKKSRW